MSLDKGLVQLASFGDGLALAGTLGVAKVREREGIGLSWKYSTAHGAVGTAVRLLSGV